MVSGTLVKGPRGNGDLAPVDMGGAMIDPSQTAMQMKTRYATAISVQKPRSLAKVEEKLLEEADKAGATFYYGWGNGKDRVEGPSVHLAMAAVRLWGNAVVEMRPVQETHDAWIFTAAYVDLETGFTIERQFRQSKSWTVHGKFDEARKEDIRFQIGQSKAIRNVVVSAVPRWLVNNAMEQAMAGVRAVLEKAIEAKGIDEVRNVLVARLARHKVTPEMILAKFDRPTLPALTIEDLVVMRGDHDALDSGADTLEHLYPPKEQDKPAITSKSKTDQIADELAKRKTSRSAKAEQEKPPEPVSEVPPTDMGEEWQEVEEGYAQAAETGPSVQDRLNAIESWIDAATSAEEIADCKKAIKELLRDPKGCEPEEAAAIDKLIKKKAKELGFEA